MPNNYDKYKTLRQINGKLVLADPTDEGVIHLLAANTSREDICLFLPDVTLERIDTILESPLAKKRLEFKRKLNQQQKFVPKTPDECLEFAKRSLVKLSKSASSDKIKVDALKALASVAIDERKNGPQQAVPVSMTDAMTKLIGKD